QDVALPAPLTGLTLSPLTGLPGDNVIVTTSDGVVVLPVGAAGALGAPLTTSFGAIGLRAPSVLTVNGVTPLVVAERGLIAFPATSRGLLLAPSVAGGAFGPPTVVPLTDNDPQILFTKNPPDDVVVVTSGLGGDTALIAVGIQSVLTVVL